MPYRSPQIANRQQLTDHGQQALRGDALDVIEAGLRAADPYRAAKALLRLEGDMLTVGDRHYDLRRWNAVYVIGAGKASQPIALALEETLGERISAGVLAVKRGEEHLLRHIRLIDAAHPVPDAESCRAAGEMLRIAHQAQAGDIVFAVITGGSSALAVYPAEGVSLEDKQALNRVLLECGASIREINAVRKHVSRIKGGRLAQAVFPAELINLTVSDVVGDPLDYITDLTVPDTSTWEDALRTMHTYHLWDRVPASICRVIEERQGGETPKAFDHPYHTFLLVDGDALCRAAAERCQQLGYAVDILTRAMEGECSAQAAAFADHAKQRYAHAPAGSRIALIAGGETTVTLDQASGRGGPNQEFALCAAQYVEEGEALVIAAVDADGSDGPTDAAGGLVDGSTQRRAREKGCDLHQALRTHDSYTLLEATGDLIFSGPTGTNVNDLMLALMAR
ncbi:MAG: DUF4147 domain-containing protein [Anaerolineae bacterium]|nr:DUF4147 domain-containing protein [Anaerolineae bacterium]